MSLDPTPGHKVPDRIPDSERNGNAPPDLQALVKITPEAPRKRRADLTAERLRELLHYDPETGEFRRRVAISSNVRVGDVAGCRRRDGYRRVYIDGASYAAHRPAFLYMTGKFPDLDIDHIDGNPDNNAWSNLREATASQNSANSRRRRSNRSGHKGVSWAPDRQSWRSNINVNGRQIHLGYFTTKEKAAAAYVAAATRLFGEFARAA